MVSFFRDDLYRWPRLATMGTEIPERLIRRRPAWTDNPPVVPPANPDNPFGDPPKPPHEVDPPRGNPYNEPGCFEHPYDRSFIVTNNLSRQTGDEPSGGLLGRLNALMLERQIQPAAGSASIPDGASEYHPETSGSLHGGLLGRLLALQMQQSQVQPESNGRPPQTPDVVPSRRLVARFER
jgi:hypothetical protein